MLQGPIEALHQQAARIPGCEGGFEPRASFGLRVPEARRANPGRANPGRGTLEGKEMRETEQKRAWAENKPIGREELGRVHDEEEPRGADEALTVPDYVMRDFGLPEEDEKEDHNYGIGT